MNRRDVLTSIVAIAGAGSVVKAVEQKPDEPKVLFYVLELPGGYEDPTDGQIQRIKQKFEEYTIAPVLVMPHGTKLSKCTELPELATIKRQA